MLPSGPSSKSILAIFFLLSIALRSGDLSAAALNATAPGGAAASNAESVASSTTTTTTTKAATTVKTTTAAVQTTKKARKPRRLCAFPFWHLGQWHHQCLEYGGKGAQWCSLTQNFTRDEEWRECARYDLMRYKCTVPFHHGGKSHTQCQPLGVEPLALPTFWCALVPSLAEVTWQNLGADWTFCEAPNATDAAYLKSVGLSRSLEEALIPTPSTATTGVSVHSSVTTNSVGIHNSAATTGVNAHGNVTTTGVGIHGNAAVVVDAAKSISGASGDGASAGAAAAGDNSAEASSGPGSGLGITLGVIGVVLATVAVAAAFMVHRRNQYKRIDPLLSTEPGAEKGSYGGMQAYHD